MDLLKKLLLVLVYLNCVSSKRDKISPLLNNEIDTARCRSNCMLSQIQKYQRNNETCEPFNNQEDENENECTKCWTICQQISNGTYQTWSEICQNQKTCGEGCKTACKSFKNKSKQKNNRHLTKCLGSDCNHKKPTNRDENRVPRPRQETSNRLRNRNSNHQRRRQRIRYKDIRLDVPKILENCVGMSWTDPTKNINFASSRRRNRGRMYHQRRQDYLHALIYILFARNNVNEWFELTQTTQFSYNFTSPPNMLQNMTEMQLLAVSNYGVIDHVSLDVSRLNCDAEKFASAQRLRSPNLTQNLQRFRRTFRNEELNELMALIQSPPDRFFLPLVIGCLILALVCIFMLVLLIFKSMFKSKSTLSKSDQKEKEYSDSEHSLSSNFNQSVNYGTETSEKDFSVFTIYEPDLISTHISISDVEQHYQVKHTQL